MRSLPLYHTGVPDRSATANGRVRSRLFAAKARHELWVVPLLGTGWLSARPALVGLIEVDRAERLQATRPGRVVGGRAAA